VLSAKGAVIKWEELKGSDENDARVEREAYQ